MTGCLLAPCSYLLTYLLTYLLICLIYGSETWPMKMEHEVKLDRTEISVIR